ncbi:glutathione peroxidase [Leptolyngbya sp. 7M]|uniref:glutathione peroxidase n=1 Tax=Leptolyngbya sp. 7M TaxID=2812896 RepID=UPI001B8CA440|nr:glutathione peroxidase [Leptolyngbya sp. 7M]QYO68547.1 glutathione peroxidase [Leptolyngbya sp. 7M]
MTITDLSVTTIEGHTRALSDYLGQVLLIVNVASYCGYTSQYQGLEALYQKYREQGLEILAFPCNDYGMQEPDSLDKIQQFCQTRYGVTFPLFDKVHAKGAQQHPLYAKLTQTDPKGDVAWNFEKFLINKHGAVVARFKSAVAPDAPELIRAIERELAA